MPKIYKSKQLSQFSEFVIFTFSILIQDIGALIYFIWIYELNFKHLNWIIKLITFLQYVFIIPINFFEQRNCKISYCVTENDAYLVSWFKKKILRRIFLKIWIKSYFILMKNVFQWKMKILNLKKIIFLLFFVFYYSYTSLLYKSIFIFALTIFNNLFFIFTNQTGSRMSQKK